MMIKINLENSHIRLVKNIRIKIQSLNNKILIDKSTAIKNKVIKNLSIILMDNYHKYNKLVDRNFLEKYKIMNKKDHYQI